MVDMVCAVKWCALFTLPIACDILLLFGGETVVKFALLLVYKFLTYFLSSALPSPPLPPLSLSTSRFFLLSLYKAYTLLFYLK